MGEKERVPQDSWFLGSLASHALGLQGQRTLGQGCGHLLAGVLRTGGQQGPFLGPTVRSHQGTGMQSGGQFLLLDSKGPRAGLVLVREDALNLAAWDLSRWWPSRLTCDHAGLRTTHVACAWDTGGHRGYHWVKTQVLTSQISAWSSCPTRDLNQLRNDPALSVSPESGGTVGGQCPSVHRIQQL